jgi:hypothetical protein
LRSTHQQQWQQHQQEGHVQWQWQQSQQWQLAVVIAAAAAAAVAQPLTQHKQIAVRQWLLWMLVHLHASCKPQQLLVTAADVTAV